MFASQPDLFSQPERASEHASVAMEPPPPDFIDRIRAELEATLHTVQHATSLPWPDLTRATLAELRFNSISGWLPEADAKAMRAAFEAEMTRLYALEDERGIPNGG